MISRRRVKVCISTRRDTPLGMLSSRYASSYYRQTLSHREGYQAVEMKQKRTDLLQLYQASTNRHGVKSKVPIQREATFGELVSPFSQATAIRRNLKDQVL